MKKELFKLALHGLKGKKRSSLLTVIILTISFAAVLVTLCITGSIIKTNAEYRLNTYGAWYGAIPYGIEGDAEFLSTVNGIGEIGAATVYGQAVSKSGVAVINKVDLLNDFAALEARKKQVEEFGIFDAIVTVSAKDGTGCEELFPLLKQYANPGPHYFDDDAFTDMPEKELVAELVREKALLFMREEIPHGIAVTVESFKERPDSDLIDISVEICCERKSHKGMIIGKGGQMLKKIASAARMDCEELLGARVNLQCWVKVREDWRDNDRLLDNLGFAKP